MARIYAAAMRGVPVVPLCDLNAFRLDAELCQPPMTTFVIFTTDENSSLYTLDSTFSFSCNNRKDFYDSFSSLENQANSVEALPMTG